MAFNGYLQGRHQIGGGGGRGLMLPSGRIGARVGLALTLTCAEAPALYALSEGLEKKKQKEEEDKAREIRLARLGLRPTPTSEAPATPETGDKADTAAPAPSAGSTAPPAPQPSTETKAEEV